MNRIYFAGNPWPDGHRIKAFAWSGRLEPESGLWFDFHLESDDYYADDQDDEDEEDEDVESDWASKIVWNNYHSCTLSSTEWGDGGFMVGSAAEPFDFTCLTQTVLRADPLETYDFEERAFHIYLLGHDAAADHRFTFSREADGRYSIEWQGKIALYYVGSEEFVHSFRAGVQDVEFEGFLVPDGMSDSLAKKELQKYVTDVERYTLMTKGAARYWVWK
ncbi:hypothetical protein ACTID9_21420 [Brevibacillus fluminis]|uniref:hypothetical protein n=1 Tax=Brevibacillus fluminis TaxID=511487 RepID=UPI003F8AE19D